MYVNGALAIVLIVKESKIDISLILYTIFEWIGCIILTFLIIINISNAKSNINTFSIFYLCYTFCVIASTTLGIYWIDNIILENVNISSLYIRQLKISFSTLFIISLLFKSFIFIKSIVFINGNTNNTISLNSDNESNYDNNTDKESTNIPSTLTNSIPSSKQSAIKLKDSLQTLVSKTDDLTLNKTSEDYKYHNNKDEDKNMLNTTNKNELNLNFAKIIKVPSRCETTETTDISKSTPNNTDINIYNNNKNDNVDNLLLHNYSLPNIHFKEQQILDNMDFNNNRSTPIVTVLTSHISEEDIDDSVESVLMKHSNFQFPKQLFHTDKANIKPTNDFISNDNQIINDIGEENEIQMLNISEPLHISSYSNNISSNGKINNISLKTWNEKSDIIMSNEGIYSQQLYKQNNKTKLLNRERNYFKQNSLQSQNTFKFGSEFQNNHMSAENEDINSLELQSFSSQSSNCLVDELNKEIIENGSHQSQIQLQQSLPNLRLPSRQNSVLHRGGSFSQVLRSSISSSNMNSNYIKNKANTSLLNLSHQKSNSLSAISMSKSRSKSRSRSHSPLKRFRSFKDSLQITPRTPKQTRESSPIENKEFELDLNLANSIRRSPKKKVSCRSISSRTGVRKISLTSPTRNETSDLPIHEISNNSPINLGYDLNLSLGDISQSGLSKIYDDSPSNKKNHFKYFTNDDFIIQNRLKAQQRVISGVSSTDKSTVSTNSVPSGYYGEYDKEKWRAFKKVQTDHNFLKSSPLANEPN